MIGILLISHGKMAEGMLDSSKLLLGESLERVAALGLTDNMSPEQFDDLLHQKISNVDEGHGVIIMCDLISGTPFNRCMLNYSTNPNIKLITGMNFPMLLELLGMRFNSECINQIDIDKLIEIGKNGITTLDKILEQSKNKRRWIKNDEGRD